MTENDYIAEFIKERYPTLLGLDFKMWKTVRATAEVGRKIVEAFNNVDWSKVIASANEERNDKNDT